MRNRAPIFLLLLLLSIARTLAWPTMLYNDHEVSTRADLIVVAHLRPESITRWVHNLNGRSYEHRAKLVITECLKGKVTSQELPVMIHYGLLPAPAKYKGRLDKFEARDDKYPCGMATAIEIHEDNPSEGFFRTSPDVCKDQIWLLRKHYRPDRPDPDIATTFLMGVWDPEDIQPIEKKAAIQKCLTQDAAALHTATPVLASQAK